MVEQHSEDVVLHRESAFDHEEESREDLKHYPFMDWRLNVSHVLSLIAAVGTGLFAFLSLGHEVTLNFQETKGQISLLKAGTDTVHANLAGRIAALEEKALMRTSERQSADQDLREQLRELRTELTESRRLIAQHMSKDR